MLLPSPAEFLARIEQFDREVRAAVPKCPHCGRPDGGVIPSGKTPWEAGLVDRLRCPVMICPMRELQDLDLGPKIEREK
jgi:hypothetical protein